MKVQDFFSFVQLGVGIHAGTAILQLSVEFGLAPIERRIDNISAWLDDERREGNVLESREQEIKYIKTILYIYKSQYSNLYRRTVLVTLGFGGFLAFVLAIMSFIADSNISTIVGLFLIILSVIPAMLTFSYLWQKSTVALMPIEQLIRRMEGAIRAPSDRPMAKISHTA